MARARRLDRLAGHEDALWCRVDDLIAARGPRRYDEAVALVADLRDLAARFDADAGFGVRLDALRDRHARKAAFIGRLRAAGL